MITRLLLLYVDSFRYAKYSRRPRAALSFLLLWQRYPNKEWYCAGHDDTLWSTLALSAWFRRFDPKVG